MRLPSRSSNSFMSQYSHIFSMLHYLYFRKSLWTSRQCSNRHVNHYYDHAASPQVPQIRQHINEEQKISRSRLLIPPAINMRTQNSSPLPPGQRSTIHTLSSFRKKNFLLTFSTKNWSCEASNVIPTTLSSNINKHIEQIPLAYT